MILTCPECATRYFVDGAKLGPGGRTVRCVGCGNRWHAHAGDDDEDRQVDSAPSFPAPPSASAQAPAAVADPSPATSGDALPQAFRAATQARRRIRKSIVAGAVWGGLGVFALALVATAAIFRVDIVHMWPRTAGAYAMVGMPVNPTGLAPEGVQAAPSLQNGRLAVIVSGMVRNVETHPRDAAALKVSLLDKSGHALVAQVAPAAPGQIEPGKARPFKVTFIDPPAAGVNVQVEFVLDHAGDHAPAAHAPAAHAVDAAHAPALSAPGAHPAAAPAHGPEPVLAKSIAADSPYALPPAAAGVHAPAPHPPAHAEDAGPAKKPAAPHG